MNHQAMSLGRQEFLDVAKMQILVRSLLPGPHLSYLEYQHFVSSA